MFLNQGDSVLLIYIYKHIIIRKKYVHFHFFRLLSLFIYHQTYFYEHAYTNNSGSILFCKIGRLKWIDFDFKFLLAVV